MDLEGQPAQPSDPGVGAPKRGVRGHSQEKSPRNSEARTPNSAMDPGLQLGPPSVRKGSGESYPDPSETEKQEKRKTTKHLNWEGRTDRYKDKTI